MYATPLTTYSLSAPFDLNPDHHGLYAHSNAMQVLKSQIKKVAHITHPTIIFGETGVGKELCAREIHQLSPYVDQPWVAVNCAAIPKELLHAELFGAVEGAFTGSKTRPGLIRCADQGTLFLDEIGELSLESQACLLRVLEKGEIRAVGSEHVKKVTFRLLSATHRDLPAMIAQGLFRADLYHRITTMTLQIPPLRNRLEDIKGLIHIFAPSIIDRLTQTAWNSLYNYPWPGNVRELKNVAFRLEVLIPHGRIFAHHIRETLNPPPPAKSHALSSPSHGTHINTIAVSKSNIDQAQHILTDLSLSLRTHVQHYIHEVLLQQKGNISHAAKSLQIDRSTVHRHLKNYMESEYDLKYLQDQKSWSETNEAIKRKAS